MKRCPKCDEDISDTYIEYDPSMGLLSSGWYCDNCDLTIPEEDEPYYD